MQKATANSQAPVGFGNAMSTGAPASKPLGFSSGPSASPLGFSSGAQPPAFGSAAPADFLSFSS